MSPATVSGKSYFLCDYFGPEHKKAMLLTRPRRFGKTVLMTMLRDFLDVRMDSTSLFEGLEVMNHRDIVDGYMNKYPVVFISLKEVYGDTVEESLDQLTMIVSNMVDDHNELFESEKISKPYKEQLDELLREKADKKNVLSALALICKLLARHYGKPTYVLIDEYDVPLARTAGTGAYDVTRPVW